MLLILYCATPIGDCGSYNGSANVYQVTVEGLKANEVLTVNSLSTTPAYAVNDIMTDNDGKAYLWLPDGSYNFTVNRKTCRATVNGAATTAVISDEGSLTIGSTETLTTIHDTDNGYANYYLTTGTDGTIGFYRAPSAGIEIPAGKAWLQVTSSADRQDKQRKGNPRRQAVLDKRGQ